ncbi:hypothetical protein N0V82_001405 [Gnomoniopsis sp. IMI 355080]|nr:hypothetical protein N0V82_001405 [Gnomoniopsis sp. IMI 355080]
MGGRIDCYFDIASLYSYLAFAYLIRNLKSIESHGVHVEFHPILLGAVNAQTGNKPPWSVPAKAVYGSKFEGPRATAYFGRPDIRPPKDLMPRAHTILPLRTLHYIKRTYSREIYHAVLENYFHAFWMPPNLNLTQVDVLAKVIAESGKFSSTECEAIMAAATTQEIKDSLTGATQEALDRGAFGAPWLWATNGEGTGEPFFGSDRFGYVYNFLGLPYQDVELLGSGQGSKL